MITLRRCVLLAAALACFSVAQVSSAAAAPAATGLVRTTDHFDEVTGADCIGESIHLEGDVTSVLRTVETSSGNLLTGGHTTADMTVVGVTTGTSYTLVDSRQITTNILGATGQGYSGVGAWTWMLVSRGAGQNLIMTTHYKVTVTATGEVAVDLQEQEVHCVG
jgi:hypothetical protein